MSRRGAWLTGASLAALVASSGCAAPDRRPNVLVVVLDTTRADAVSAYGAVAGTTPTVDALARAGVRYTRAYVQAPWTLPSHATLFTGLLPSAHGVSWGHTRAADELTMLAERLRDAGYQTFGVSENPWVSEAFNMTQGFEAFRVVKGFTLDPHAAESHDGDVRAAVTTWVQDRRRDRPFFVFVNVLDAHLPYLVRDANPFLPDGVDANEARAVPQAPEQYFCRDAVSPRALAILRGLYLGGVHAADRKLGGVLAALTASRDDRPLVTIVTSDHGEHFGEHRRVGHQFSVYEPLLRVPLVVHGVPGVGTAVVDTPVASADVVPTVLALAGVPQPPGLAGRALPFRGDDAAAARAIVAEHDDSDDAHEDDPDRLASALRLANREVRRHCSPDDGVFGAMRALVRGDTKLAWYERHPPALYDLRADPGELRDQSAERVDETGALTTELAGIVERAAATAPRAGAGSGARAASSPLPSDVRDRLQALGYLRDDGTPTPTP